MSSKRSRVHPAYKTEYRVTNWATYNQVLVKRGSLGLWISPDAIASWNAKPSQPRRGGQPKYSSLAIETALTLGSFITCRCDKQKDSSLQSSSSWPSNWMSRTTPPSPAEART